jgi:hypothetical protein
LFATKYSVNPDKFGITDMPILADWFDEHLLGIKSRP